MNELTPETSFFDHHYFFIRHGKAEYGLQKSILTSPNPRMHADIRTQPAKDLVPNAEGEIISAAVDFFSHFDRRTDHFFFASSPLTRAQETADLYASVARERGFTIITPKKSESPDIRTIQILGLPHIREMLIEEIYKSENYLSMLDFEDKIGIHYRTAWEKCRSIIEKDNRGSWGANFLIHSQSVKDVFDDFAKLYPDEVFPQIFTASDAKRRYTQGLERLAQVMEQQRKRYSINHTGKSYRVLAFGHENHMLPLMQDFGHDTVPNHIAALAMSIIGDTPCWSHK